MSLTRKRKKELQRLRSSAEELWNQQQVLLDQANAVAREASRQAGFLAREHVAPRVREHYHTYVRPGVDATGRAASSAASSAKDRFVSDVLPAVGTAIGTAMTVADHARDARNRTVVQQKSSRGSSRSDSDSGVGKYVAITFAVIAAVGVLYAIWQTFRADDELWVADEEDTIADSTE